MITKIESDSRVNQETGQSFYLVTAKLNEKELSNDDNKEAIKIGMQVQGRTIVDEQSYLSWAVEKLELWIFN